MAYICFQTVHYVLAIALLSPVNWVGAKIGSLTSYTRFKCTNETQFDFIFVNQRLIFTFYPFNLRFKRISIPLFSSSSIVRLYVRVLTGLYFAS